MRYLVSFFALLVVSSIGLQDTQDFEIQFLRHLIKQNLMDETFQTDNFSKTSSCDLCKTYIKKIQNYDETTLTLKLKKAFSVICPKFDSDNVCKGINDSYVDTFVLHFFNHILDPQDLCASLNTCDYSYKKADILDYIQEVLKDQLNQEQQIEWISQSSKKNLNTTNFKVLHLADLHIDLEYTQGSNAFCNEPFCCRPESGLPKDVSQEAQYWGTLASCDIPLRTLQRMIEYISSEIDIDMIVWTGDNISHDVWHQNKSNQTLTTRLITEILKERFGSISLYPIFGNHEAYPADQFDMQGNSTQWLKDEVADMWTGVLTDSELRQLSQRGFYSSYNDKHNLKVIALNTQACDSLNFFLMENVTDPGNELAWLRIELQDAEDNNQFAYIFAHIPPGDTFCGSQWSERYAVLIERYVHVIKGQFFGHTHWDHVETVNSRVDGRPLSTLFIAPSGTTFSFQNPSFRVFDINGTDNSIIDYNQYRLDLTKANQEGNQAVLQWNRVYSFVQFYGLKSASNPIDVLQLVHKLENDKDLMSKYLFNFHSGSEILHKKQLKDLDSFIYGESTKKYYLCGIQTSVFDDYYKCVGKLYKLKDHDFIMFKLLEKISGAWREPVSYNMNELRKMNH